MGDDTKAILIGKSNIQEIAARLKAEFGGDVSVIDTSVGGMFVITLPDPKGRIPGGAELRSMYVHTDIQSDYREVLSGPKTICSLGAFGGSVEIMEALAKHFGGFVCDRDSDDEWRFIDRSNEPIELPMLDRFRIEIEKVVGASMAVHFAALDRDKIDKVIAVYAAYLNQEEVSA